MRHLQFLLLIFGAISVVLSGTSHAFTVPEGWRVPSKDEYINEVRKRESKDYLAVQGDFNGDGVSDEARLCVTEDGQEMGIIVWISRNDQYDVVILDQSEAWLKRMGVGLVKPGKFKTACGKGYWGCAPDEPEVLSLTTDAINYFMFESANSFFYWDSRNNVFKRIWMSD